MSQHLIKLIAIRNPSFHSSIIPLFPFDYLLEEPKNSDSAQRNRFFKEK